MGLPWSLWGHALHQLAQLHFSPMVDTDLHPSLHSEQAHRGTGSVELCGEGKPWAGLSRRGPEGRRGLAGPTRNSLALGPQWASVGRCRGWAPNREASRPGALQSMGPHRADVTATEQQQRGSPPPRPSARVRAWLGLLTGFEGRAHQGEGPIQRGRCLQAAHMLTKEAGSSGVSVQGHQCSPRRNPCYTEHPPTLRSHLTRHS